MQSDLPGSWVMLQVCAADMLQSLAAAQLSCKGFAEHRLHYGSAGRSHMILCTLAAARRMANTQHRTGIWDPLRNKVTLHHGSHCSPAAVQPVQAQAANVCLVVCSSDFWAASEHCNCNCKPSLDAARQQCCSPAVIAAQGCSLWDIASQQPQLSSPLAALTLPACTATVLQPCSLSLAASTDRLSLPTSGCVACSGLCSRHKQRRLTSRCGSRHTA